MDLTLDDILGKLVSSGDTNFDMFSFAESVIIALLFGLALKSLYSLYFRDNEPQDGSLACSLILLTPSLTTIFWMIQTSVVLSLGLLGSMSFVRFRTPVKRSEDVTFIVLSLAIAVSCAIQNFAIGLFLISMFLAFTLVRNYFGDGLAKKGRHAILTFNTKKPIPAHKVGRGLESINVRVEFVSSRTYDGITSLVFNISKLDQESHDEVIQNLSSIDEKAHINVFYPSDRLGA